MATASLALILFAVLLNTAAQLLLKAGTRALDGVHGMALLLQAPMQPLIVAGLTCYVISFGVWLIALARVQVSVAYPLLSIGYIMNAVAAWWLFSEELTTYKIVGLATILVGVVILSRS